MKLQKINLEIKHINKKCFIHTPEYLPKLHNLVVVAGARGSGKTYSCTNLIRLYKKEGLCDRVIIISPTGLSNKVFYEDLINGDDDIITDMTGDSICRVIDIIEQEAKDYNDYLEQKKIYEIWQKFEKGKIDIDKIPPEWLIQLMEIDFEMEPPKWKYKNEDRPPLIHVMIDDAQGSPIMRSSGPLINFAIKHRHIAGIGCSLYILCQSYISTSSCPRCIRENSQTLMLFRVRDDKLKETLAEECTPAQFKPSEFLEAYNYATGDDIHDFLMVDYSNKKDKIFRKNFDVFISFEDKK